MALEGVAERVERKCKDLHEHLSSDDTESLWGYYVFTTYGVAETAKPVNTIEGNRSQTRDGSNGGPHPDIDPQASDLQASSVTLFGDEPEPGHETIVATDTSAPNVAGDLLVEKLKNYLVAHINQWIPEPYDDEFINTLRFKHISLAGASFADVRRVLREYIKAAGDEWMKQPAIHGYGPEERGAAFGSRIATCLVIDDEVAFLLRAGPEPVLELDADGYYDDEYEEIREKEKNLYVKVLDADYDDAADWRKHIISMRGRPGPNLKPEHCQIWPGWMKVNPRALLEFYDEHFGDYVHTYWKDNNEIWDERAGDR